ncbi:MAG: hypothetical protein R3242_03220 [Akkermansiaceae bacterium]|nr:hypothetical protein [Akkermansiaceae bacterium]
MNSRFTIASPLLIGLLLASCVPIEGPASRNQDPPEKMTDEQQRLQELEQQRLAEQQARLLERQNQFNNTTNNTETPTIPTGPTDYPFASKVPGKEGFVFSPYNKQVVDVRDIPSGTLVQDPTYPASEKKYFRVP